MRALAAPAGGLHRQAHPRIAPSSAARPRALRAPARSGTVAHAATLSEQFDAQVCVVLGTQWGDEGKGKLVDILAQQYEVVARAQVCGGRAAWRSAKPGVMRLRPMGFPLWRAAAERIRPCAGQQPVQSL